MADAHTPCLQQARLVPTFAPPDRVRMCPDTLILISQERIRVKLVGVQSAIVVILNTFPRHWMVASDGDLREDVVFLDWNKYVIRRDFDRDSGF